MSDSNLKRTLIIPEDGPLAAQLFQQALDDLDVVLFVVLGKANKDLIKLVDWRARAFPTRQAVWILDPALAELAAVIDSIRNGNSDVIAATYSKTDRIVKRFTANDTLDALAVETAFSEVDNAI